MPKSLTTKQPASQVKVIFTIDRRAGKIVSVAPVVDTDAELSQLDSWIEACLLLSGLIQPAKELDERAAA